ncbi:hypothetical protein R6Z02_15775 [Carnobacterium maltaromaticum]|uniref:pLS20_p028 family conjugation system transmembrane protein n=1 Tax=Lactobacillales TaxID=186826 RepID=UPI00298AF149|nr:hypothetical protein [Carnobacterium maltaromaticum]MDW5525212.1 hypothetical protein [Carnobacterium maltaromaticum]
MEDSEKIEILLRLKDILSKANWFSGSIRFIGWMLIILLVTVNRILNKGFDSVLNLLDFTKSPVITNFIASYMPVYFALGSAALAYLGWKIVIQGKMDYNKIVTNVLIAITLFLALPWGLNQATTLTKAGVKMIQSEQTESAVSAVNNNIVDMYFVDDNKLQYSAGMTKNDISNQSDISILDINEVVDTGGFFRSSPLSKDGEEVFKKKVVKLRGNYELVGLENKMFGADEEYYRYHFDFLPMFIQLLADTIVLAFLIYKCAQIILEIGILQVIAQGALTDIESGQRNRKIIEKLRNAYLIIFIIVMIRQLFVLLCTYISTVDGIDGLVKAVVILALAVKVANGPNFVEELFGISAGLSDAGRSMMGALGMANMMRRGGGGAKGGLGSRIAKASGRIAGKTGRGAANTIAGAAGALSGFKNNAKGQASKAISAIGSMAGDKNDLNGIGSNGKEGIGDIGGLGTEGKNTVKNSTEANSKINESIKSNKEKFSTPGGMSKSNQALSGMNTKGSMDKTPEFKGNLPNNVQQKVDDLKSDMDGQKGSNALQNLSQSDNSELGLKGALEVGYGRKVADVFNSKPISGMRSSFELGKNTTKGFNERSRNNVGKREKLSTKGE